ncbi:thiamine/thiamine pyrophosphate ABC transporter, permease protein [Marinomonas piezotolerans]|uniref:Thiamine transport system permease protein ThiP n=1 Tax=Marinomonas piezotolerans TaxID=2213058 RepID=A0A370U7D6_9GAMM|nr:thiamine/thiamine pyrophosphate ABC transporter permease [Marinomonas piezotolerans]RDL43684.1 thiamine/thiamine pyrophosphate ABC transporter, permease protein [Marinomonas piezotolerans]
MLARAYLRPAWIGLAVYLFIAAAAVAALLSYATPMSWGQYVDDPYIWRVIRFSLWQALLSALISIVIAIPVASCLFHRRFIGRQALLNLFAISMVVPTIVAILGIVVVYGRSGWASSLMGEAFPLYGLVGILIAHVFFNMPLAVRMILQTYSLVPDSQWRLASQLGLSRTQAFRLIEWNYIKKSLPGLFLLIFMLCFSSFAVVLTLGGGPRSSTLEVAIYQALRFEFDLSKASYLSLLQILICTTVALCVYRLSPYVRQDISVFEGVRVPLKSTRWNSLCDISVMMLALLWVIPPFVAIFTPIFSELFWQTLFVPAVWVSVWHSLRIALPAGVLALVVAMSIASLARAVKWRAQVDKWANRFEQLGNLVLMVPGLVLATGLFIVFRELGIGISNAYWIVVWVNAMMALPFVLRAIMPTLYQQERRYRHLYDQYGIVGSARLMLEWQSCRSALAQGLAYAVLLSLGDLGVVALFGSENLVTLPMYLFQLVGSYRIEQGACVAVVLIILCLMLFLLINRGLGGRRAIV